METSHQKLGEQAGRLGQHLGQHLRARTEEVDAIAALLGGGQQLHEQVDPGHPLRQRGAQDPARPHHGLAVGQHHVALGHRLPELRVPLHGYDLGRVDHPDGELLAMIDRSGAPRDGLVHGERVDRQAEQFALHPVTSVVTHTTPTRSSPAQDSQV